MFQAASRNRIIYNTVIDGGGLAEFGSTTHTDVAADNVFAYNLLIDNGMLTWLNTSSTFAINVSNVQYYNNTIISTPADLGLVDADVPDMDSLPDAGMVPTHDAAITADASSDSGSIVPSQPGKSGGTCSATGATRRSSTPVLNTWAIAFFAIAALRRKRQRGMQKVATDRRVPSP